MKLGLAQIDTRVGDFTGNARRIVEATREAAAAGAELVLLPELAVTGYPPRDLLLDERFVARATDTLAGLADELRDGPALVVGAPIDSAAHARFGLAGPAPTARPGHPGLLNAAVLLTGGRVAGAQGKRLLPAYDVFHEPRWFAPDPASRPLELARRRLGLLVCEDVWDEGHAVQPVAELRAAGASVLLAIAASPFRHGIVERRLRHARRAGAPIAYVNAAGANDELVFDGGSFALAADATPLAMLARFREAVAVVELPEPGATLEPTGTITPPLGHEQELLEALALGVRGFVSKNRLPRAVLGVSGGVDSALVACIAVEALGADRVSALALPARFTDPRSTEAARALAETLGLELQLVDLEPLHAAARRTLGAWLDDSPAGRLAAENLQARLRMLALAAFVNRHGGLLLNTSNKTELSLGYGTLWGDLAGTLSVIGDLTKTEVYALARWLHATRGWIPDFVLERPPSAELAAGQTDPFDYAQVAPLVESLVQAEADAEARPAPGPESDRYRRALASAEHKRVPHGLVLKVSERAFGSGRLVPVTKA